MPSELNVKIRFPIVFCLLIVFLFGCSMQKTGSKLESARGDDQKRADKFVKLEERQERAPLRVNYLTPTTAIKNPEIFVYKEKRRLYVIQSGVLVRDYPIGLGFQSIGDKEKDGDGKTPEGDFLVCSKDSSGRFFKSLGLNYPDKRHAEKAFFAGVVKAQELHDILLSNEKKSAPPSGTALGGKICIRTGGAHKDWTDGSIALYDSDLEELYQVASVGTPVSIRP